MIGDVRQHMLQIGFGIEAVELGRPDEGIEDGGAFASAIGAGLPPLPFFHGQVVSTLDDQGNVTSIDQRTGKVEDVCELLQ
jgi:hypothetical protein